MTPIAEFEHELIKECTINGLDAARARTTIGKKLTSPAKPSTATD